jgi:hypothetical protein
VQDSLGEGLQGLIEVGFFHIVDELWCDLVVFQEEIFRERFPGLIDKFRKLKLGSFIAG